MHETLLTSCFENTLPSCEHFGGSETFALSFSLLLACEFKYRRWLY
jgi:hypothetical protein